jgi:hypothetical protein
MVSWDGLLLGIPRGQGSNLRISQLLGAQQKPHLFDFILGILNLFIDPWHHLLTKKQREDAAYQPDFYLAVSENWFDSQ